MWKWLMLLVVTSGCAHIAHAPVVATAPMVEARACYRSFSASLAAFEQRLGRVGYACQFLDSQYTVQLASLAEIPCMAASGAERVHGCTTPVDRTIYVLAGRDQIATRDTSVHEWLHTLLDCVYHDADREHVRAEIWEGYGANTAEVQAQAAAPAGACL
jgi:hypothetical protein